MSDHLTEQWVRVPQAVAILGGAVTDRDIRGDITAGLIRSACIGRGCPLNPDSGAMHIRKPGVVPVHRHKWAVELGSVRRARGLSAA